MVAQQSQEMAKDERAAAGVGQAPYSAPTCRLLGWLSPSRNERSSGLNEPSSSSDEPPSGFDGLSPSRNERSSGLNEPSSSSDGPPSSFDGLSSSRNERSSGLNEASSSSDEPSFLTGWSPSLDVGRPFLEDEPSFLDDEGPFRLDRASFLAVDPSFLVAEPPFLEVGPSCPEVGGSFLLDGASSLEVSEPPTPDPGVGRRVGMSRRCRWSPSHLDDRSSASSWPHLPRSMWASVGDSCPFLTLTKTIV